MNQQEFSVPASKYLCNACGDTNSDNFYPSKGRRTCKKCILGKQKGAREILRLSGNASSPSMFSGILPPPLGGDVFGVLSRFDSLNSEEMMYFPLPNAKTWRETVDDTVENVRLLDLDYKSTKVIIESMALESQDNKDDIKTLVDRINKIESDNKSLHNRVEELTTRVNELQESNEKLENENQSYKELVSTLEERVGTFHDDLVGINTWVIGSHDTITSLVERVDHIERNLFQ